MAEKAKNKFKKPNHNLFQVVPISSLVMTGVSSIQFFIHIDKILQEVR